MGTVLAAAVNCRTSARSQEQLLASEAEGKKLDSLQEALDAAGSALERMHWALMAAVQLGRLSAAPSGEDWDKARDEIEHARAETSVQGTRLAVRLGTHADCVVAYDEKKEELFTTKTFSPTGDVSTPISASFTDTTPSQMGSKPCACMTGNMIGSVITMMAIGSMKQPRMVKRTT